MIRRLGLLFFIVLCVVDFVVVGHHDFWHVFYLIRLHFAELSLGRVRAPSPLRLYVYQ